MSDKKEVILVTGACGRIGSALIHKLCKEYRVVGFELLKAFCKTSNEELVPCDISSDESTQQALNHLKNFYGDHISSVIHLAAYYSFKDKNSENYKKITIEGTRNLLKGLQHFKVDQFIFSSSMLVHQPCMPGQKINENWPVKPRWAYPISKVKTEQLIREEKGPIPSVTLRIAGVYDDMCHSIPISQQIQRIYENQMNAHLFAGNLTHGADFIHMQDVVDAFYKCVSKRSSLPKDLTLLIGEGKTLSYNFLQKRIFSLLFDSDTEFHTHAVPKTIAKLGAWVENKMPFTAEEFIQPWMIDLADDHYELDISKAKEVLGWTPIRSLEKTLPIMIDALKRDPIGWYKTNGLVISDSMKRKLEKQHYANK